METMMSKLSEIESKYEEMSSLYEVTKKLAEENSHEFESKKADF